MAVFDGKYPCPGPCPLRPPAPKCASGLAVSPLLPKIHICWLGFGTVSLPMVVRNQHSHPSVVRWSGDFHPSGVCMPRSMRVWVSLQFHGAGNAMQTIFQRQTSQDCILDSSLATAVKAAPKKLFLQHDFYRGFIHFSLYHIHKCILFHEELLLISR